MDKIMMKYFNCNIITSVYLSLKQYKETVEILSSMIDVVLKEKN